MAFSASTANIQALVKKTIDERNLKSKRKNSSSSLSYSNLEELRRIGSSSSLDTRDVESLTTNNKKLMTPAKIFYRRKLGVNRSPFNIQSALFVIIGVLTGFILANLLRQSLLNCKNSNSCCPYSYESNVVGSELKRGGEMMDESSSSPNHIYTNIEESKRLVFIGVMTAQKYLDTRAKSVFETWGQAIPGKMSFFSRSGSSSQHKIPLVSLPGVDDSYPPQKKSFMMLKFMHDNYLEKFEWFMRVDDDVYIRPDKLELFLRSINSSKPQFIGQAGLGNEKEFGLLSLDYDENFCMGGPGIVMSRETLRLVVPHISYCLKNLYSTHEDVEIGRCVRKFANVSCTWAYEMQNIFHHNSSGNQAYSGELLSREVLRAVSLHPIKRSKYQYRVHNFFNQRKIHDLRHRKLELKRRTFELKRDLLTYESNRTTTTTTTTTTKLMMEDRDEKPIEVEEGVFESLIFNRRAENLSLDLLSNRFDLRPTLNWQRAPVKKRQHRHDFEFFTRSLFSPGFISPKRGLEGFWKKALAETVRQLMDDINKNSIERGRIIDFKDILYGYMRHDPLIGVDYILDILLVYRKYEGRKMTVQVRRHAYVRNTYTSAIVRENDLSSSIFIPYPPPSSEQSKKTSDGKRTQNSGRLLKRLLPNFLLKYLNSSNDQDNSNNDDSLLDFDDPKALEISRLEKMRITSREEIYIDKKASEKWVNFVVPLTGRWAIFKRFMRNYERVCIERGERTRLVVVLFENEETKPIEDDANQGKFYAQSYLISSLFRRLRAKYAIDDPKSLLLVVNGSDFSRSIGCEIGAAQFSLDSLIFFVDVDMVFTTEFLIRARLNTIQYKQVYYPIVYSEYDPDDTVEAIRSLVNDNKPTANGSVKSPLKMREKPLDSHFDFNQESGYWRQFGFGIVSVYNSDLRLVGGFDTKIIGWGKEDVDLYEKFIASNITVFRAVDIGLVHVFHKIECDPKLADEQMIMCLGSKATSIASQTQLARLILRNKALLKTVTEYNFTTIAPSTTTFKPDGKTTTNLI